MNQNFIPKYTAEKINKAAEICKKQKHGTVSELHLLSVLVKDQQFKNRIMQIGGNPDQIKAITDKLLSQLSPADSSELKLSYNLNKIISRTIELTQQKGEQK